MAFLEGKEIWNEYEAAVSEAKIWREDYPEYERLMSNGLLDDLDETLPEVNDGSLAAALFKLPKRIINSNLTGRAKSLDVDDSDASWITELANIVWETTIIKNANSQAPFHRKWKDAVRKAAGYGSIPLITLFLERGNYTGSDFIVAQAQDVKLQAGRVSDYDSDILFWDLYLDKLQVKNMIEEAKEEMRDAKRDRKDWLARKQSHEATNANLLAADPEAEIEEFDEEEPEPYNRWDISFLQNVYKNHLEEDRSADEETKDRKDKAVKRGGYHFVIAVQRGVNAPFTMKHASSKEKSIREWSNPDPSGDVPIHYLYCYQDFVNPYGIGIAKLAGGTQNALDYFRQADIKAVQIGIDPPLDVSGDAENVDIDSLVNSQRALWFTGDAKVTPVKIANEIMAMLPDRIGMYKTSLNQLIPTGDTSIAASAGDPNVSKTPAGQKNIAASLSIDDDDFKDNVYMTYEAKAKSMINTHFANMQGTDLLKLSDDERDILMKAGLEFPADDEGTPVNEIDVWWDEVRATFDFEMDADQDKSTDDEQRLTGLLSVAKLAASDPNFDVYLLEDGKKLNRGELYADIIALSSDNKKIVEDVGPEDDQALLGGDPLADPNAPLPPEDAVDDSAVVDETMPPEPEYSPDQAMLPLGLTDDEAELQQIIQDFGITDRNVVTVVQTSLEQGFSEEEIADALVRNGMLTPPADPALAEEQVSL